jgi:hypothetical protein
MATTRWHAISAYVALLLTCAGGVFRLGPWAAVAGAALLALISLAANRTASVPEARMASEPVMLAANLLNSAAIASAAYIFGYVARWMWGL